MAFCETRCLERITWVLPLLKDSKLIFRVAKLLPHLARDASLARKIALTF